VLPRDAGLALSSHGVHDDVDTAELRVRTGDGVAARRIVGDVELELDRFGEGCATATSTRRGGLARSAVGACPADQLTCVRPPSTTKISPVT
jgi:hypothetical protein